MNGLRRCRFNRLSALPDCVIIQILSFLGVKRAAITSVLSKRWRFLWAKLPSLEFRESSEESEKIREFVAMVNRTLFTRSGTYLEKFGVGFRYREWFASDVDVWVEFVRKNKVKEVTLQLNYGGDFYTLPEMMYSNSSLTSLWTRGCIIAPQRTIEWQSLTSLEIQNVELPWLVIEKILSGCPVLYSLVLRECWGFSCLKINSQSLYKLGLYDHCDGDNEPLLEISAPYIHYLVIVLFPEGRKLHLRDIPSLVRADIEYCWSFSSLEVMSSTKELLENIHNVQEFELGMECFEVVSMMAVNGWQLPQSRRKCFTVNVLANNGSNISGIIGLLESSLKLETLVIEGLGAHTLDPLARDDLVCDLLHLKTITITEFADPNFGHEPMVTLARILLKRATVLEKMVLDFNVENISDFEFDKICQTLLTFPRSSQKLLLKIV